MILGWQRMIRFELKGATVLVVLLQVMENFFSIVSIML